MDPRGWRAFAKGLGIIRNAELWRLCRDRHNRHAYAVHLLRCGTALKTIGDLLGHRSAATGGQKKSPRRLKREDFQLNMVGRVGLELTTKGL